MSLPSDDTQLIEALKAGQEGAFRTLVLEYQEVVINTCFGFLRNREDAEDLAQEVFLEVYRSVGGFREQSKLSTWLYRIAVTKSLDLIRKRKRKKRSGYMVSLHTETGEAPVQVPGPEGDNPQQQLEQSEMGLVLEKALNKLSENQRIAFTLHKLDGMSYKQIAEIMGSSVSAVESLIHRARKNLRKNLERYYQKLQQE